MRKLKSRKQGKGEKQNGITEEKGKRKGERKRERESYRQFMRPHLPLGNRVSLKRRVDSFVGCVINSSTTSRQITRLGCITI